jgi:hypothetical protein
VPPKYESGEPVRDGDRIRYAGELGHVEFVADPDNPNEDTMWFIEQYGQGCMPITPRFGRVFLDRPEEEEDLELVSRD